MCPQNGFNVDFLKLGLFFETFLLLYVKKCIVQGQWSSEGVFLLCLLVLILKAKGQVC
jgi:hypothetical protein